MQSVGVLDDLRPPAAESVEWRLIEFVRARAQLIHNRAVCAQQKAPPKEKVAKENKEPKAKKTKANEDEKGEPKKKTSTGYMIFSQEKRKEVRAVLSGARQAHPHARAWLALLHGSMRCVPATFKNWQHVLAQTLTWSVFVLGVRPRRPTQRNHSP